jgi:hypothetical protein
VAPSWPALAVPEFATAACVAQLEVEDYFEWTVATHGVPYHTYQPASTNVSGGLTAASCWTRGASHCLQRTAGLKCGHLGCDELLHERSYCMHGRAGSCRDALF